MSVSIHIESINSLDAYRRIQKDLPQQIELAWSDDQHVGTCFVKIPDALLQDMIAAVAASPDRDILYQYFMNSKSLPIIEEMFSIPQDKIRRIIRSFQIAFFKGLLAFETERMADSLAKNPC